VVRRLGHLRLPAPLAHPAANKPPLPTRRPRTGHIALGKDGRHASASDITGLSLRKKTISPSPRGGRPGPLKPVSEHVQASEKQKQKQPRQDEGGYARRLGLAATLIKDTSVSQRSLLYEFTA